MDLQPRMLLLQRIHRNRRATGKFRSSARIDRLDVPHQQLSISESSLSTFPVLSSSTLFEHSEEFERVAVPSWGVFRVVGTSRLRDTPLRALAEMK